jgi:hypothetical protein
MLKASVDRLRISAVPEPCAVTALCAPRSAILQLLTSEAQLAGFLIGRIARCQVKPK